MTEGRDRTDGLRAAGLLAIAGFLAYGVQIPWLGFYFDDWFFAWLGQARGAQGLIESLSGDRPFSGLLFAFNHLLLGDHPFAWHTSMFGVRLIGAVAFRGMLCALWPSQRAHATIAALLFLVYPGFLQQPISIMYQNYQVPLTLIAVSLWATVRAQRSAQKSTRILATLIALLMEAGCHLVIESYLGYELVRVILIGWALQEGDGAFRWKRVPAALKRAVPYLLAVVAILVWRLFFFTSTEPRSDVGPALTRYVDDPLNVIRLGMVLFKDFMDTAISAWFVPAYELLSAVELQDLAAALLAGGLGGVLVFYYYRGRKSDSSPERTGNPWELRAWMLGAVMIVLGLAPSLLAGETIWLCTRDDRFTLPAAMGAALLLTSAVTILVRCHLRALVFAAAVAGALSLHYANTSHYRAHWHAQRDLWWQLAWRAPQLQEGTLLALSASRLEGYYLGSPFVSGHYEVWGPLNRIYSRNAAASLYGDLLSEKWLAGLESGQGVNLAIRGVTFQLPYSDTLIVAAPTESACLRVIDASRPALPGKADFLLKEMARHSRVGRVVTDPAVVARPSALFGDEPPHGWCYFLQKAELARQREDWQEVVILWEEARRRGLEPNERSELDVFSEAFSQLGGELPYFEP